MAEVLLDVEKISSSLAQKLGPDMVSEISKRQKSSEDSSSKNKQSASKRDNKESNLSQAVGGYREGSGSQIDSDASELRSGRFAGVIGRKVESIKKIHDSLSKPGKFEGIKPPEFPHTSQAANNEKAKYNILEIKEAKIAKLEIKGGVGGNPLGRGSFGSGVPIPSNGSGVPRPNSDPDKADPMENKKNAAVENYAKFNAEIPLIGAAIGITLGTISAMAGMHQQVLQAQEATHGAYGGIATGGGGLLRNPEVAQVAIARSRVLGLDPTTQDMGNPKAMLGVKFGLTQGIGGTAGAELFAKMEKYGSFRADSNSVKKVFSDGIKAGFTSLRLSEYMQKIASVAENAYNSGMGEQKIEEISNRFASIKELGARENRVGSVYEAMNADASKKGGMLNSMLLASYMDEGGDFLDSSAKASKGIGDKDNVKRLKEFTSGMDVETINTMLYQNNLITAEEANIASKKGKSYLDLDIAKTGNVTKAGNQAMNRVQNYGGQKQISHANELDQMALGQSFQNAYKAQDDIFKTMIEGAKMMESSVDQLTKIKKYYESQDTFTKTITEILLGMGNRSNGWDLAGEMLKKYFKK